MKLAIGSDHAGFAMKTALLSWLESEGHTLLDCGAYTPGPSNYPEISAAVSRALLANDAERGILLCGSGVGASIAANKIPGIRAALAHDAFSARQAVHDDDANIICLGPRVIGLELAKVLVTTFLAARFSGEERHVRRLRMVEAIERGEYTPGMLSRYDQKS